MHTPCTSLTHLIFEASKFPLHHCSNLDLIPPFIVQNNLSVWIQCINRERNISNIVLFNGVIVGNVGHFVDLKRAGYFALGSYVSFFARKRNKTKKMPGYQNIFITQLIGSQFLDCMKLISCFTLRNVSFNSKYITLTVMVF